MTPEFNLTFRNARISPAQYPTLLGWSAADVAEEPEHAAALALASVNEMLSSGYPAGQDENGINLDGRGWWSEAGNGHGLEMLQLLELCEPGAILHDIGPQNSSGVQQQTIVRSDRSLQRVTGVVLFPGIDVPADLPELFAQLRAASASGDNARSAAAARSLLVGFDSLDITGPKDHTVPAEAQPS